MPKTKKDSHPFSIRMATDIYDRMEEYCEETGVPKTVLIEKSICMYLNDYEKTREHLKQLKARED